MSRPATTDLRPLLAPRSVAVIGASAQGGRATGAVRNLQELGFTGQIYPVNPKYDQVLGLPCYPSLAAIPGLVDLVCIGIPSEHVHAVLEEAHAKSVRGAVVFASGYGEAGEAGVARQRELQAFAARTGMLICGPNCLGVLNFTGRSCGYSSITAASVATGGIGLVSQSGTIVVAMVRSARGFGFSHMVSSGNECVLDSADYLDYLVDDPSTRVLVSYLEGIGDPAKFLDVADRAFAARKPLIVVKSGRSDDGSAASAAHTGALAGSYKVQSAIFRQKGIVHCDDLDEMTEAMEMFSFARAPSGTGIGVIGISGGENALVMDQAAAIGLPVPKLSETGRARLAKLLPWFARPENPIDPTGAALGDAETYVACIEVLAAEPDIGVVVVSQDSPAAYDVAVAKYVVEAAKRTGKCIVYCNNFSGRATPEILAMLRAAGVPYLQGLREGLKAVKAFIDYAAWQAAGRPASAANATPSPRRAEALALLAGRRRAG